MRPAGEVRTTSGMPNGIHGGVLQVATAGRASEPQAGRSVDVQKQGPDAGGDQEDDQVPGWVEWRTGSPGNAPTKL